MRQAVSWLFYERCIALLSSLLISIAVARHLGPDDYGLLGFVLSFAAILTPLAALGLNELVTKELVTCRGKQGEILGTVFTIRKVAGLGLSVLFAIYCFWGPFPTSDTRWQAILVLVASLAGDATVFRSYFAAEGKLPLLARFGIARTIVIAALRLALVLFGFGLDAFIWAACADLLFAGALSWLAFRLSSSNPPTLRVVPSLAPRLLRKSWPLALSQVAAVLNLKIDIVLLTILAGANAAGTYTLAANLSEGWLALPAIMLAASFPLILQAKKESPDAYDSLLKQSMDALAAIATVIAIGVTLIAPLIVPLIFGSEYADTAAILAVHVWGALFLFMRALASKWLIAEDYYVFSLVSHASGAAINVVLNFALIPLFGGIGAALATVISYAAAGWLAFGLNRRTRPIFLIMASSLLWPLRFRSVYTSIMKGMR